MGWALLALAPLAAVAGSPINQRKAAEAAGQVEISNTAGSVTVSGWNRNEVEVTGELGEGSERLDFTTTGKLTRIKVILPNKSYGVDGTDLVVKVPAGSGLYVNTVSADLHVTGVQGAQRLQSVSGDARVSRVAGEVNGNTVSGNFNLELGDTSRSRLRSTSGDLGVSTRPSADARFDIESISGDVRLDLAGPPDAEFEVTSFNGEIRNCMGPKAVRTSEYAPGRELRFREGAGSARVRIKTLNGDISVCRK